METQMRHGDDRDVAGAAGIDQEVAQERTTPQVKLDLAVVRNEPIEQKAIFTLGGKVTKRKEYYGALPHNLQDLVVELADRGSCDFLACQSLLHRVFPQCWIHSGPKSLRNRNTVNRAFGTNQPIQVQITL